MSLLESINYSAPLQELWKACKL